MVDECSICLSNLRRTRSSRELDCGHVFHHACIKKWKESGSNTDSTCPLCRKKFDVPLYKVVLSIENTGTGTLETTQVTDYSNLLFMNLITIPHFTTEFHFSAEDETELQSMLSTIGVG